MNPVCTGLAEILYMWRHRDVRCLDHWLVVEPSPLKTAILSLGIRKFPTEWKGKTYTCQTTNQYYKCEVKNNF